MELKEIPEQTVMAIRTTTTQGEISQKLHAILPEVWACVTSQGGQPSGPPFSRYYTWSAESVDMEAGFPVVSQVSTQGDVIADGLPGGKVAYTSHMGPYDQLHGTYMALESWIKEQGLTPGDAVWEVYVTDPAKEPDPSKVQTDIYWTVK